MLRLFAQDADLQRAIGEGAGGAGHAEAEAKALRPMFRSLAKVPNPQQKHYMKVLEGVKDLVEESVAEHDAAAAATAAAANTPADDEEEHYAGLMA